MRLGRSTKQGRDELTYNLTCGAARPPPAVMQKLKPYITREYGIAIAVALIAVALGLRAMGILGLTVAFWSGFASCLALEAWAAYYFLIKLEFKTEEKLEAYAVLWPWLGQLCNALFRFFISALLVEA